MTTMVGDARTSGRIRLNGIPLDPLDPEEALAWILDRAARPGALSIVSTINLQLLRTARHDPAFAELLRSHTALNLVDGWPVAWLLRRRNVSRASLAPGSDLTDRLLRSGLAESLGIYLLGDSPSTIDAVRQRGELEGWSGVLRGSMSPPREAVDSDSRSQEIVDTINSSEARILLVAFGAPRQEFWLRRWSERLQVPIAIGIGGSLKFVAWPRRRAPIWMRRNGLEWLHRLYLEPTRLAPRYARDMIEVMRLFLDRNHHDRSEPQ